MMGLHTLHTIVMDLKIICANENLHYIKETLEKEKESSKPTKAE